jgi:hypothetical protein
MFFLVSSSLLTADRTRKDEAVRQVSQCYEVCLETKDNLIAALKQYPDKRDYEYNMAYHNFRIASEEFFTTSQKLLNVLSNPKRKNLWRKKICSFQAKCNIASDRYRPLQ